MIPTEILLPVELITHADLKAFNESLSEAKKREIVLRVWEQVVNETGLNTATQHNIQLADKLYREELGIMQMHEQFEQSRLKIAAA